jgi:hypothetical protein
MNQPSRPLKKLTVRKPSEILAMDCTPNIQTIIEDGCVRLVRKNDPHWAYDFELNRIASKDALLQWVHHLCGKVWMDRDSLGNFIEVVAKAQGLNIYKRDY